jgi:hypothetical protein
MTARKTRQLELFCGTCGYGIACPAPPTICPMCHAVAPWREIGVRRFRGDLESRLGATSGV